MSRSYCFVRPINFLPFLFLWDFFCKSLHKIFYKKRVIVLNTFTWVIKRLGQCDVGLGAVSFCIPFSLLLLVYAMPAKAIEPNSRSLVIFSGHEQIPLQAEIHRGFSDEQYVIGTEDFRHFTREVYIERVDAYRNTDSLDYDVLAEEIYRKYERLPSLIVAEGNPAQRIANRLKLMADQPTRVLAVNTSQNALQGYSKAQLYNIPKSLEAIVQVMPGLETLYVIAPASRALEVQDLWDFDYSERFDLELLDETVSPEEIADRLSQSEPNSAVFWLGRPSSLLATEGLPVRIIKQIADLEIVPVFGMQSSLHKAGGAGGFVMNAELLGRNIARLTYDLGIDETVPASELQFDYLQAEHWGFELGNLATTPILFNKPQIGLSEADLFKITTLASTTGLLILGFIVLREVRARRQKLAHQTEIQRVNEQFHSALAMSEMVLFEENVRSGEATFIVRPPIEEGDKPLVGQQRLAATLPEYRAKVEVALATQGEPVEFPMRLSGRDSLKWVRSQMLGEYRDYHGDSIRLYVSQDLTESYESQESLVNAYKEVEDSLKHLKNSSERQKQLFAVVGHELRTPAASLNMMLESQFSQGTNDYAEDIRATAAHLINVLDDLRAVVEPELIRAKAPQRAIPYEVVERSVTPLKDMITKQGMRLSLQSDLLAGEYAIFDQRGIRQVVTNLVKNAVIHSGANCINLQVSVESFQCQTRSNLLRISVHDDGKGVAEHMREKIFDAFERADATADGTGLGLHICREIIKDNGGELWIDTSAILGGAAFEISMPIESVKSIAKEPDTISPYAALKGKRLLVAEDNPMLRKLTENIIKGLEAECTLAENGREALELMKGSDFDLIVTDIFMPELDGYELVKAVRSNGNDVPIIGVTAATVGDETDRLLEVGADLVLSKPITKKSLESAWAEWLEKSVSNA